MPLLKEDVDTAGRIKGTLASIVSELSEVDSLKAKQFCEWLLEKAKYYRKHFKKERFQALPDNMKRGDIVWVKFGINVGDEFSDDGTDGHFAIVWGQKGFIFIVIPISKQSRTEDGYSVNIGRIQGLPQDADSYAKVDLIRAINIRRIERIRGQPNGKITIQDQEIMKKIQDVFMNKFVNYS